MAMEAAIDLDAGDFSVHSSHSGAGSRSNSAYSRATGITGVDVESGEAASLVGGKGHRSIYAALAEEALLGAATPCDPEGAFEQPFEVNQPIEIVPSEYQDANGSTWRMGSAGAFWRLDSSSAPAGNGSGARCCITSPDDFSRSRMRSPWKAAWAAPVAIGALALITVGACWNVRAWLVSRQDANGGALVTKQGGCCTAAKASCFACRAGLTVEAFCETKGAARGIVGCEEDDSEFTKVADGDSEDCCRHETADCLACKAHQSVKEYCSVSAHANVTGCTAGTCSLVEHGVEYPGGDLYSVGSVASSRACCAICREEPKCTSWSWGGSKPGSIFQNRCFLKRQAKLRAEEAEGYVSGLPASDDDEYQLKSWRGICLESRDEDVRLQACGDRHDRRQRFVFQRGLRRVATGDGHCLEAASHEGASPTLRSCDSSRNGQQWHFNSATGTLRIGKHLCLHAPHKRREGGRVEVRHCKDGDEDQQWSFWSSAMLGQSATIEAMRREALKPTTTTVTTTPMTTSTTTTRAPTLFCFSVMVSWNYEPNLVRMQVKDRRSIFSCDGSAVYSNEAVDLGSDVTARVVQGTDLRCHKGGEFMTLLNTPVFKKVWEQVLRDDLWKPFDWTAKVDCDAVFFPERLRHLVQGPALGAAQDGRGIFLNNCGFGLHGPIEVVSRRALETYGRGWHGCDNPPQEDVYLQACMNKLGVTQVNQFSLLSEEACRTPNWQACQSEHVSFHPFKDREAYQACELRAERIEKHLHAEHR